MKIPPILIALLAVSPSFAVPTLTFERALGEIQGQIHDLRLNQSVERLAAASGDIARLGDQARRLEWDASRLRRDVSDLRRRARSHAPNQPGRPSNDPFFDSDVRRAAWAMRDLARESERAARDGQRIATSAQPDGTLVGPAQRLGSNAQQLQSETRWLESEARWASMDLRRLGYNFEAWDLERYSSDSDRAARELEGHARTILSRVTPPAPTNP